MKSQSATRRFSFECAEGDRILESRSSSSPVEILNKIFTMKILSLQTVLLYDLLVTTEAKKKNESERNSIEHVPLWDVCRTNWGEWSDWGSCSSSCDGGKITRTRKCFYDGECAITDKDSKLCINKRPVRDDFCEGAESANSESMPCNVGVKCK